MYFVSKEMEPILILRNIAMGIVDNNKQYRDYKKKASI
jgi:hypothetical protein